jgi:hypothetical protein
VADASQWVAKYAAVHLGRSFKSSCWIANILAGFIIASEKGLLVELLELLPAQSFTASFVILCTCQYDIIALDI